MVALLTSSNWHWPCSGGIKLPILSYSSLFAIATTPLLRAVTVCKHCCAKHGARRGGVVQFWLNTNVVLASGIGPLAEIRTQSFVIQMQVKK